MHVVPRAGPCRDGVPASGPGKAGRNKDLGHTMVGSWPRPAQTPGTWYVKAMVASGHLKKRTKELSPVMLTALDGGDLEATFTTM